MSRRRKYPRISNIRASHRCSLCAERSIVSVTVQTGWSRSDDERFHLCAAHYKASGARPLPEKSRNPSEMGRDEALLRMFLAASGGQP